MLRNNPDKEAVFALWEQQTGKLVKDVLKSLRLSEAEARNKGDYDLSSM